MNDRHKTKDQLIAELQALRQSERKFRRFFGHSLVGVGATSADRRWLDVNDTLCQMFGYTREELLNLTWSELTHPDDLERSSDGLRQLLSGETQILAFEKRYVRKDGQIITALVQLHGVYGVDGRFEYAVVNMQDISDRQQAERALRASEARANLIYQSSSDAMFLMAVEPGPLYRCISVNAAYLSGTGLDATHVIDRSAEEILPPAAAQHAIAHYAEAIRVRHPIRYEESVDLGLGLVTVETTLSPIFDADGRCSHLLGASRDISERKRMDEVLRESERRHRLLANNADDVIWTMDLTGRFTYVSPSVERLRGYTVEEVLHQSIDQALMPESAAIATARLTESIQRVLAGQTFPSSRYELEQPCKDGRTVWTEVTTSGMYDEAGQFIGILGVTRDISERRRAETLLRESEELYRSILIASPDNITITDLAGHVRMVSLVAVKMLGVERAEDLIGQVVDEFLLPEDRARANARLAGMFQGQPFGPGEYRLRRFDGQLVEVEVNAELIRGADGLPNGVVLITRDITARKQAEAALRASEERYRLMADAAPLAVVVTDAATAQVRYANQRALDLFEVDLEHAIGSEARAWYADLADRAHILAEIRQRGAIDNYDARMRTGRGREVWVTVSASLSVYEGRPALHAVYYDSTVRKQAQLAEREQRELAEALRDTAAALNSTLKFDEVLDQILTSVERVIQYDAADILMLDSDHTTAWFARHRSHRETHDLDRVLQWRLPMAEAWNLREMLRTGEPVIVSDTHTQPGWVNNPAIAWIRSNLGLPIRVQGETLGFVSIDSAAPQAFSAADAERLRTFADQVAAAIRNAQLHEQVQRHAADLERRVAERTAELERERMQLQAILDAVDEAIYFMDTAGHIRYANAATSRITGYEFNEIVGRRPDEMWRSTATPEAVHAELDRVLAEGAATYGG
ncbi:MAG: MEKHLA domain-containing protein, partial [Thermoflexales bacterium]|nr:MEKHLA domain-containing protein [Thermoflexales bacterium]